MRSSQFAALFASVRGRIAGRETKRGQSPPARVLSIRRVIAHSMSFPTETGQVVPDMFRSASEENKLMRGRTSDLATPVTILWRG